MTTQLTKKDQSAVQCLVPVTERIRLRTQIKRLQSILKDSKKSDLFNQNTSSRTGKVTDKEGSSSSSKQKEIDDMYGSIEQKVFGRDKDRKRICRMLREEPDVYGASSSSSKPYRVIGIYGMAGSGKSTLAQYVCSYEKEKEKEMDNGKDVQGKDKRHFSPIMFIHVRKTFSVGDIFRDMLEQIKLSRPSNDKDLKSQEKDLEKDLKSLEKELAKELKDKCFLLVLDDLWVNDENNEGHGTILLEAVDRFKKECDILHNTLCTGQSGSVILVTAQRKDAAAALGGHLQQIKIRDLEEEEYLSLFMHHALQGSIDVDGEYERIGRRIAKKLHRSPIAAVTVAKQLQMNRSIRFWKTTANLDMLSRTMGALWWSYQQFRVDIRQCFAYCSTFPKGYELNRDELVRIWIAQGFVNTGINATEELEDIGQGYFEELLKFSFLQVKRYNVFTIHDLLHELAERVAGSDFFRVDDLNRLTAKDIPPGVRHLFIGSKNAAAQVAQTTEKNLDMGNLRTLIIDELDTGTQRKQRRHDLEKLIERLFMRLRKLRVLIIRLDSNRGKLSFPASIDQMKHLRYLSFRCPNDRTTKLILPGTFSMLYQMQTILFYPGNSVSYPDGMTNLIRLRHMLVLWVFPNIGRMTSLLTMHYFYVKKKQGYELKQLKHLNEIRGRLEIYGLENVGSKEEALEADVASKKRVTDLSLCFGGRMKDAVADMEAEVLEGLCPPKDLKELTIQEYKGSWYPSWMLSGQHHPDAPKHLRRLALLKCSCPLASFPEDSELFMNLLMLDLIISFGEWDSLPDNMECLVSLRRLNIFASGDDKMVLVPKLPQSLQHILIDGRNFVLENMEYLVSLKSLGIRYCDKMEVLPTLPQSLQSILISDCGVLSRTCKEKGHENWQKVQHIGRRRIIHVKSRPADPANWREARSQLRELALRPL